MLAQSWRVGERRQNSSEVERCIFRSLSIFFGSACPGDYKTPVWIGLLSILHTCVTRDFSTAEAEAAGAWTFYFLFISWVSFETRETVAG